MKRGLAFIFLFCSVNLFSQSTQIADSLGKILKKDNLTKEDRSRLLGERAYHLQDIDSSLLLAREALKIAVEIDHPL